MMTWQPPCHYTNQANTELEAYDDIDDILVRSDESCVFYDNSLLIHDSDLEEQSKIEFRDDGVLDDQLENAYQIDNDSFKN